MGLRLTRHLGSAIDLEPGQYATRGAVVIVCCPTCSEIDALDSRFLIGEGGKVTPVWVCATETCGASEWLELESWGAEDAN